MLYIQIRILIQVIKPISLTSKNINPFIFKRKILFNSKQQVRIGRRFYQKLSPTQKLNTCVSLFESPNSR